MAIECLKTGKMILSPGEESKSRQQIPGMEVTKRNKNGLAFIDPDPAYYA